MSKHPTTSNRLGLMLKLAVEEKTREKAQPHYFGFQGDSPVEELVVEWIQARDGTWFNLDELDFDQLKVRIALNWSPVGKCDKLPKTHERRRIDMTGLVADRLLAWRPVQRQELLRRGAKQTPYVFTSRRGARVLQGGTVRLVFARVMRACGIAGHTLYDFRDSFASHHLADDWYRKLTWVSKQLGHKHVSTTERPPWAIKRTLTPGSMRPPCFANGHQETMSAAGTEVLIWWRKARSMTA